MLFKHLLLKFIGEQDSGKKNCQGYHSIFNAIFSQILTFWYFLLINDFFQNLY